MLYFFNKAEYNKKNKQTNKSLSSNIYYSIQN